MSETAGVASGGTKRKPRPAVTAPDLERLLATRYPAPQYAFLSQVRNGTGYTRTTRTADALAMSLWPSRGMLLEGFEIKVSRADWKREAEDPEKAEEIARFCDRWWIVAPDDVMVPPVDLPPAWGLLVVDEAGKGLRVAKDAVAELKAQPITRTFLAGILRNVAACSVPASTVEPARHQAYEAGRAAGQREANRQLDDLKTLQARVAAFEAASGLHIADGWRGPENVGKAVRVILDGGIDAQVQRLQGLRNQTARLLAGFEDGLASLAEAQRDPA